MSALDEKIRPLYESGLGCRRIAHILNDDEVVVFRRVRRMGIVRHTRSRVELAPSHLQPFTRPPEHESRIRSAALGEAVRWFLARGYTPSFPLESVKYDLVVDLGGYFQRVQIKSTSTKQHGRWFVRTERRAYDALCAGSVSSGKRKSVAYTKDDIDVFFVVTADRTKYIIPVEATCGARSLILDTKYAEYIVAGW